LIIGYNLVKGVEVVMP